MAEHPCKSFWDRVNTLLDEHDVSIEVDRQVNADGTLSKVRVSKLIAVGYLEIVARGVVYRSVPTGYSLAWVSWTPFKIVGHFSQLDDPSATVRWVKYCERNEGDRIKDMG